MMRCLTILSSACLACSVLSLNLNAAFVVPEFRGLAETTYQEWNVFTSANGLNLPDVANVNPNGTASVQELTGGAFLTSGGNIYSFAVATSFDVLVPDYGLGTQATTRVVLQLRTQGSTVDLASVTFNGQPFDSAELLYEEPLGGFGGTLRDWRFEWSAVSGNVGMNTIQFDAEDSSMSLDRVSVDTQALAVAMPAPVLVQAKPYHNSFAGVDKVDQAVNLLQRGTQPKTVELSNLISSSQGINGVMLDFDNLTSLGDVTLEYKMSPQNVFTLPVENWIDVPPAPSAMLQPDSGQAGSDLALLTWPDAVCVDRYLCIKVTHGGNTISELYLGHLRGEMTGDSDGKFTVLVADILAVRSDLSLPKTASGRTDVDKSGTVLVQDILDTRANLSRELTQITIPAL
ncbi:MAG TPA: hypothetical protein DCF63_14305 [Planctomycetaceae bacterium]|nr:hypothetical protein [Planctomycetaceae bacterium]